MNMVSMALALALLANTVSAEPVVPGTGRRIVEVGDDFEDPGWHYVFHPPKSSRYLDGAERHPLGESSNGRWYEGIQRGHPDIVRRIATPGNGLPGSRGALLLQSLETGVPGRPRFQMGQDDLIADVHYRLGGSIPVALAPSVLVRVFLPPVAQWEKRSGPHFGFRVALETPRSTPAVAPPNSPAPPETYWPGMFIEFQSRADNHQRDHDYAFFRLRADRSGRDVPGGQITTTGWWTLGISLTPDGAVHYYARAGVENLSADDHLASEFPYGYRAEGFKTFFFNICNGDDGQSWSTPWVIDDPGVYLLRSRQRERH
jgi:hypothetical protein